MYIYDIYIYIYDNIIIIIINIFIYNMTYKCHGLVPP